eukprot:6488997-Amphidinium_carterae.1
MASLGKRNFSDAPPALAAAAGFSGQDLFSQALSDAAEKQQRLETHLPCVLQGRGGKGQHQ